MKLGEKIRRLRVMKGLTQKEFGQKIGFSATTADSRVRKYESCQMAPKEDMRRKIADVLDVDLSALSDIDIETYEDIMHIFFFLEDELGMKIERSTNRTCLLFENSSDAAILNSYLYIWNSQKQKCEQAAEEVKSEAKFQYDSWRARFPKDISAYWKEQKKRLYDYYGSYIKAAEASGCTLQAVSDFIVKLREMSKCEITIEAGTILRRPGNGSLVLTFLLPELLAPEKAAVHSKFGEYLYQISLMESYGMKIDTSLFTTEIGTQISYVLHLSSLMSLKSVVNDIQRFEKQPDSNDWDKEMFENAYEDTLRLYNINFKDEIRRHI